MSIKLQQDIVNIVRRARKEKGLSLTGLSEAAGCSDRIIAYWEQGRRIPRDIETIQGVLNRLGYELVIRDFGGARDERDEEGHKLP